jgi:type IX secretion system PorP/SprF family membrane protein
MNLQLNTLKKIILCSALLITATGAFAQQGLNYTQYIDNQTPINPTYSLLNQYGSVNTLVRKQWVGVPGSPTTYLINGSIPIESVSGSAGLIAENDVLAIENLTNVSAFFAKSIRLNENQNLAVSLSAGFRNYTANYSGVDPADPVFQNNIHQTNLNMGFGVMFYAANYYAGFSLPELNIRTLGSASLQNNADFQNHYYFTGGFTSNLNQDYKIKYAALAAYSKDASVVADISTLVYMKSIIGIGVNYRTNNEVAGMLSINYNVFHLGYAYEFGTTAANIGGFSNATNEVTLGIRFGKGSTIGDTSAK